MILINADGHFVWEHTNVRTFKCVVNAEFKEDNSSSSLADIDVGETADSWLVYNITVYPTKDDNLSNRLKLFLLAFVNTISKPLDSQDALATLEDFLKIYYQAEAHRYDSKIPQIKFCFKESEGTSTDVTEAIKAIYMKTAGNDDVYTEMLENRFMCKIGPEEEKLVARGITAETLCEAMKKVWDATSSLDSKAVFSIINSLWESELDVLCLEIWKETDAEDAFKGAETDIYLTGTFYTLGALYKEAKRLVKEKLKMAHDYIAETCDDKITELLDKETCRIRKNFVYRTTYDLYLKKFGWPEKRTKNIWVDQAVIDHIGINKCKNMNKKTFKEVFRWKAQVDDFHVISHPTNDYDGEHWEGMPNCLDMFCEREYMVLKRLKKVR